MSMSLPMASDTARSEARFIMEAAARVAEQLGHVELAAQDAQKRIRATQWHVEDLARQGAIRTDVANEILRVLLPASEWKV